MNQFNPLLGLTSIAGDPTYYSMPSGGYTIQVVPGVNMLFVGDKFVGYVDDYGNPIQYAP